MKITRKELKQSALCKSMKSSAIKRNGVLLFITPIFWLIAWYYSIIFLIPAIYFSYRLSRDLIKGISFTNKILLTLEAEEFETLQKQALKDENTGMFGTVTDVGLIIDGILIPYDCIYDLDYQPKKWRWDAFLLGIGFFTSPACLTVTYAITTPSGLKFNKKIKNLPVNRDISSNIEEFTAYVVSRSKNQISVHNEYHYVK